MQSKVFIGGYVLCFIVNNTMHECYFDRVVIFWKKYNEALAEYNYKVKITQVHVLFILNTTSAAK